ncbi:MAG: hypothetical protein HND48_12665 [Chloroflexi bacterium]|nr:hypothetical protein [Chloroflexota bacterium]
MPLGYVSAQLGPGAIGLTAPDNGGVILVEALGRTADAAAVMDQTLSRIGARRFDDGLAVEGGSGVTAALSYERAGVLGALYAVDANGTLVVLRIEPLTPETAHTAQAVAAGVAYHAPEATASRRTLWQRGASVGAHHQRRIAGMLRPGILGRGERPALDRPF